MKERTLTGTTTRRAVLGGAGLAVAGAAIASRATALPVGQGAAGTHPPDVDRKFYADGRVRGFLGNTIICHLPQQDEGFETFDRLLDIYRDLPGHGFSRKIAALPPSSYHMTIFGGANDQERRHPLWPTDVPVDLPIEDCNALLGERLLKFDLDCAMPIRMRVNDAEPAIHPQPLLIDLVPADDAENAKLRRLRDRLSEVLKIRAPDQESYGFHMSLGYQTAWFTDAEQRDYVETRRRWIRTLRQKVDAFVFGAPEYCTLEDMFAFRRRFYLS
jgi:hypothetical protein